MSFNNKTKARLASYKATTFPNLQDGLWKNNKKPYPHILPEENKYDNLLPTYRDRLIAHLDEQQIKLHSDFHHLNSSQAMCFNFFFPLYQERTLDIITDFLGFEYETINYDTVCFEKKGLETELGSNQPTSFDFFFETMSGKQLHFEIKYTEDEFSKDTEKDPDKKKKKFEKYYSKFLKPLNSLFHSPQPFFDNYQILRNLIHIDDNSFVIFVYPQDNDGVSSGANRVKTDFLISDYHKHFFAATWEKLFESVSNSMTNTNGEKQLADFRNKYLS